MNKDQIQMVADTVRQHRIAMGYTQKEVSEISNLSLRSIQRIENGEVSPRMHSLKVLSTCLNFSLHFLDNKEQTGTPSARLKPTKLILSISFTIITFLIAVAYIAQSADFPETSFEGFVYWSCVVLVQTLIQLKIWKPSK